MMKPNRAEAISSLCPTAQWIMRGDVIEWYSSNITQPSEEEIQQELERLQAEYPKKEAQASRASAYSQEADPLFFKYQAGEVSKEEWLAKREEIRNRYPYPS